MDPRPPTIGGHCNNVIMSAMASQVTGLTIVYSTVYSVADQRKHQILASLAFARGIHQWPVNSQHKGPVTRKMFLFDDLIMRASTKMAEDIAWKFFGISRFKNYKNSRGNKCLTDSFPCLNDWSVIWYCFLIQKLPWDFTLPLTLITKYCSSSEGQRHTNSETMVVSMNALSY